MAERMRVTSFMLGVAVGFPGPASRARAPLLAATAGRGVVAEPPTHSLMGGGRAGIGRARSLTGRGRVSRSTRGPEPDRPRGSRLPPEVIPCASGEIEGGAAPTARRVTRPSDNSNYG